jgi:hypothetical protein
LRRREVDVVVSGRGAAALARRARLHLPGDPTVRAVPSVGQERSVSSGAGAAEDAA